MGTLVLTSHFVLYEEVLLSLYIRGHQSVSFREVFFYCVLYPRFSVLYQAPSGEKGYLMYVCVCVSHSTGDPLFVSVFWSSSTATDFVSLPVRQLLDSICLSLHNYTDTEAEVL